MVNGGRYGMKHCLAILVAFFAATTTGTAFAGAVTLYAEPGFRGDRVTINRDVDSLEKLPPWNNRTRSLIVHSGTWEICKDKRYDHCRTLVGGARVADVAEVKNLRGGVSSLREVGRRSDWDDHRQDWDRDRDRWDWQPAPLPPPPRYNDDEIIWNGGGGGGRIAGEPQNACQTQVERAFIQRYGYRGRSQFSGNSVEGTIWWDGEPWQYRCAGGQTHIWR